MVWGFCLSWAFYFLATFLWFMHLATFMLNFASWSGAFLELFLSGNYFICVFCTELGLGLGGSPGNFF